MSHFKSLFIIALSTIDDDLIVSAMQWLEHIAAWGVGSLLAALALEWLKYWRAEYPSWFLLKNQVGG